MLGVESLDMAVDQMFSDYVMIMKEKFEYDSDFEKTPGDVFKDIKAAAREYNRTKMGTNDIFVQAETLDDFGLDRGVISHFILEQDQGYRGTLIEFIGEKVMEYYTKVEGWSGPHTSKGPVFLDPDDPHIRN